MDAILNFFKSIADGLTAILELVIGLVSDIVYIVKLSGAFLSRIPSLFSWLPPEIVSLIVLLITIVVLYKILGREG